LAKYYPPSSIPGFGQFLSLLPELPSRLECVSPRLFFKISRIESSRIEAPITRPSGSHPA